MTDERTYPDGVPCWVDTEQPDVEAARHFYAALFGWTFADAVPADAPGTYLIASLDGMDVAAIGPARGDAPAEWNTYIAVQDADAAAANVVAAGGSVTVQPLDAGPGGRWAGCADPRGARFRLWQPRRRPGAQLVNAPGSWNFSDLRTADASAEASFYAQLFGWEFDDLGFATMIRRPGYGDHLAATVDPGIRERQADVSAPPGFADAIAWVAPLVSGQDHWHVSFTVASRDESAATAEKLGAVVLSSNDTEWTKTAVIRDPQGAELTLSQFTPAANYGVGCQLASPELVDGCVNSRQTSGVIELSEQSIVDQLVVRLTNHYPTIAKATVESVVHDVYARFDGRPLRDYVPLLVERSARSELSRLHSAAR